MRRIYFTSIFFLLLFYFITQSPADEVIKSGWTFVGWYGGGCYPAIVPDPNVKERLYLLSDVAGLWRSDNKGDEWHFINDGLVNLHIAVLSIAPSNSDVIYIGTQAGMMRSDDAGKTWHYLLSTKDKIIFKRPDSYRSIAIDSKDCNRVYAGTKKGEIFYSEDGGKEWKCLEGNKYPFKKEVTITTLLLSQGGKMLFVASELGLMRYDVTKKEWQKIEVGNSRVWDMVCSGSNDTIYVTSGRQIAFSSDYGKTWQFTTDIPRDEITRLSVRIDRSGATKLLAGWRDGWKGGVFLSTDKGETWKDREKNLRHNEIHNPTRVWMKGFGKPNAVVFDPFNQETIYFTDWWGVWRSDDNGENWNEIIKGAPNSCGSDIFISSLGNIFVATMDNGLLESSNSGKYYKALFPSKGYDKAINGHVWRVFVIPEKENNTIIATSSPWNDDINQVILSFDGGRNFEVIRNGLPSKRPQVNTMWGQGYPRALAIDPKDNRNIYLGIDGDDGGGLFISRDGGKSWQRSIGQPDSLRIYNGLVVDPTEPNRIFWGACGNDGGVYRSEDYGRTWKKVFSESRWIFDLAISKTGIVYAAGTSGKPVLYASYNKGKSWKLLKSFKESESCEAICINPEDEKQIFMGIVNWNGYSGGKILYSKDEGKNWRDITDTLPPSNGPATLVVNSQEEMLYVLLYAGSVYKRPLGFL